MNEKNIKRNPLINEEIAALQSAQAITQRLGSIGICKGGL